MGGHSAQSFIENEVDNAQHGEEMDICTATMKFTRGNR